MKLSITLLFLSFSFSFGQSDQNSLIKINKEVANSFCLTAPDDEIVIEIAEGHQIMQFENEIPVALQIDAHRRVKSFDPAIESKSCNKFRELWNKEGGYKDFICGGLNHNPTANDIARRIVAGFNADLVFKLFSRKYCYKLNINYVNKTDGKTLVQWLEDDIINNDSVSEKERQYFIEVHYHILNYSKWLDRQYAKGLYCEGVEDCGE